MHELVGLAGPEGYAFRTEAGLQVLAYSDWHRSAVPIVWRQKLVYFVEKLLVGVFVYRKHVSAGVRCSGWWLMVSDAGVPITRYYRVPVSLPRSGPTSRTRLFSLVIQNWRDGVAHVDVSVVGTDGSHML